jgi:hypothetical protein
LTHSQPSMVFSVPLDGTITSLRGDFTTTQLGLGIQ